MKKLLTLILALVFTVCGVFGLAACDNNAGDGAEGACQHSVGADGVCTLCGKDILAKWKTVFEDSKNYKGFGEREFTMYLSQVAVMEGEEETNVIIIKNEKNKVYVQNYGLNSDGSIENNTKYEYYYENLPTEGKIMQYWYSDLGSDEEHRWLKSDITTSGSFSSVLTEYELMFGVYGIIGALERMIPSTIEYKDEVFYIYYSMYDGMAEYTIAVKNDLVIGVDSQQTIIGSTDITSISMKYEISYGNVDIVLPDVEAD